jgi:hypothetical protein
MYPQEKAEFLTRESARWEVGRSTTTPDPKTDHTANRSCLEQRFPHPSSSFSSHSTTSSSLRVPFFTPDPPKFLAPMAYRQNSQDHNVYTGNHYGSPPQEQQQYRSEFNQGYGGYNNTQNNDSYNHGPYDPYTGYNNHQPHQTYDQGGYNQYTGAPEYRDEVERDSSSLEGGPPVPPSKEISGISTAYEHDDQMAQARPRGRIVGS